MESVNLQHFLVDGAFDPDALPAPAVRVANRVGEIARFATRQRSGATLPLPVACHKRPGRRACGGFLAAYRQDRPALIRWQCPLCGYGGTISGWEGTEFDLRTLVVPDGPSEDVELDLDLHAALAALGRRSRECGAIVYGARFAGDRIVMPVPDASRDGLATEALRAGVEARSATQAARSIDLAAALGRVTRAGDAALVEVGVVPTAMVRELLAQFELEAHRESPSPAQAPARSRRRPPRDARTLVLRAALREVVPEVWRRIEVPASLELPQLHEVLQIAMGWTDSHLHGFAFGDRIYTPPDPGEDEFGEDTAGVTLSEALGPTGRSFRYDYDFGDGWEHDIVVEAIRDEECRALRCVAGENACPPEDVGGAGGYELMLEAIADPEHEEHETFVEWLGRPFDAAAFDLGSVDARLRRMRNR